MTRRALVGLLASFTLLPVPPGAAPPLASGEPGAAGGSVSEGAAAAASGDARGYAAVVVASSGSAGAGSAAAMAPEALARRLEAHVEGLAKAGNFSGVVLLAAGDRVVLHEAWGLADREGAVPNTTETRFNLGSINKVFTAAAIHQIARRGDLDLDAPLGRYLPDYPNEEARRLVTLRLLLEHRSGITGNIFAAPAGGTRDSVRTIPDFLGLFAAQPLKFAPGSREEYSNAGYVVLGAVIERVTGSAYYDYVRESIFEPIGLAHTDSYPKDALPPGTAAGYTRRPAEGPATADGWRRNTPTLPGRGSSAGGGYSTTGDLLRFVKAVEEGKLPGLGGGMGIAGGAPGINAIVEMDLPPAGYTLIVLANMDPPAADAVGREFRSWLGMADE